ncbi:uncharacterized protein LOC101846851 [Aplysia californica]|uniref:Uncharacterized protein LOC101846851 n=1 Tax=Aplysia californica TaxID=6500 RepID=A0ABM1ADB7_APLCA|nr:uncharacterized protein LOC101846851 [Aplysia californica]
MSLNGIEGDQNSPIKQDLSTSLQDSKMRNSSNETSLGHKETPFRNVTIDANLCERYLYAFTINANDQMVRLKNPHCFAGSVENSSLFFRKYVSLSSDQPSRTPTIFSLFDGDLVKCDKPVCDCLPPEHSYAGIINIHVEMIQSEVPPTIQLPNMLSFRVLMDFRSGSHMLRINETLLIPETRTCPEGHVFVPLYDHCVVTWYPGKEELQHERCRHGTEPGSDHPVTSACPMQNATNDGEKHDILQDINFSSSSVVLQISFSHIAEEIKNCLGETISSCAFMDIDQPEQRECLSNCVSESISLDRSANEIGGSKYSLPHLSGISHCSMACLLDRAFLTYTWVSLRSGTEDLEGDTVRLGDELTTSLDLTFAEKWNASVTAAELFSCDEQSCWKRELLFPDPGARNSGVIGTSDVRGQTDKQTDKLTNYVTDLFTPTVDVWGTGGNSMRGSKKNITPSMSGAKEFRTTHPDSNGASRLNSVPTPGNKKTSRSTASDRTPHCDGGVTSCTRPCANGTCLRLEVKLDGSDAFQHFLGSLADMLKTFKTYAKDHNFVVKNFDVFNVWSRDKINCPVGTSVEFIEKVLSLRNGTYVVHVSDEHNNISLNTVAFRLSVNQSQIISLLSRKQATVKVGICLRNPVNEKLSCEKYLLYNQTDLVLINSVLIVTRNQEEVQNVLDQASASLELIHNASSEQVRAFLDRDMEAGDFLVYDRHSYILTDDGAVVCSHYNVTYDATVKSRVVTLVWLPESQAELLATWISLTLSLVCLAVVLVVYGVLPELRNTPGKILMSFSGSLMTGQLLFLLAGFPRGLACVLHAALLHASWLSTFAWLTAMSGDLAYVLTAQSRGHMGVCRGVKAFTRYSLVCWGGPAIFTGLCVALDSTRLVSLGYGAHDRCWLGNLTSLLVTFCLPALLLLSASLSCALVIVRAIRRSAQFQRASRSACRRNRSRMWLCVSLSVLLGVSWLLYVPAVLVNTTFLWTPHILLSGSQGLYVIACFVMRKPVIRKLSARFCSNRKNKEGTGPKERQKSESEPRGKSSTVSTTELTNY